MSSTFREHRIAALLVLILSLLHAYILSRPTLLELDGESRSRDSLYLTQLDGWEFTPEGVCATTEHARLDITFWKTRFDDLLLQIVTTEQGEGSIHVDVQVGRESRLVQTTTPLADATSPWQVSISREDQTIDLSSLIDRNGSVNLTSHWPDSGHCIIALTNVDGKTGPLIESISLERRSWPVAWLLLPIFYGAIYLVLRHATLVFWPAHAHRVLLYSVLGAVMLQVFFSTELVNWADEVLLLGLASSLATLLCRNSSRLQVLPVLGCLIALAALSRFDALYQVRFNPLDPDAVGFLTISRSMSWLVDTQHREPLFIVLVRLATNFGAPELQLRLLTVGFSILLVGVTYWCGREIQGPVTGLVAAVLVAANSGWASQAPRGLRLEAFTICLLVLTALVWTRRRWPPMRHAAWMGAIAACICLLRITSVWFCLAGLVYGVYRQGWNTKAFFLGATVALAPLIPSYIYWSAAYGDPFYATNVHIRFYRNLEFQGQPGMPTAEQVAADSTTGPAVTPSEFFFQQHTPLDLALRTITRMESTFSGQYFREHVCSNSNVIAWCIFVSYGLVLMTDRRMLLVWMAMLLGPIAWLYGPMSGPEWRLVFHISVFCFLCLGIGIEQLAKSAQQSEA